MHSIPGGFRGPLFMVLGTGSYVVSNALVKLATDGLPPFEVLFLRGIAATLWGLPLLLAIGYGRSLPLMFDVRVLTRNLFELGAILCYVVALANMPIADATALGQITPLLVLLGASLLFREKLGGTQAALIGLGLAGALMVAQPTWRGISVYALLGLANAVFCAARDLSGRSVAERVPGMIVAVSAVLVVLAGSGAAHLLVEEWVQPAPRHLALLAGAGLFLIFGHFFLFMSFRVGPVGTVAPFYYAFTVWSVIAGVLVFGEAPNLLAIGGMALVVASGIAVVGFEQRRRSLSAAV